MYLEDLIPAPDSKRINDIVKKVFGYNLKLENLDVEKAKSLKENFTKQLAVYENKLGSKCINNQTYTQLKMVNEVLDKHIAEAREPYAVGMAAAMKSTGDKPPLKKSTIKKAHKIAKKIEKNEGINEGETEDAFGMIHQGIRDTLSKMSGQGSKFQVSMMRDHPKLSAHIYNTLLDLEQTMRSSLQNGRIVAESVILEGELETAEAVMAAKNVVDRIQGMIEDLGEILNEDLPPLTDTIRDQMDSAQAEQYASAVSSAVMSALEAMRSTREAADSAARSLAGESVDTMGTDLAVAPETEPAMEPTTDMDAEAGDEFGAADAAQGGEAPMGREKRA